MSMSFTELAGLVDELETALTQKAIVPAGLIDLSTVFTDPLVCVLRNRVITSLRAAFIQPSGMVNTSMFIMFCHTFGFQYQSIDSGPANPGFVINTGTIRIYVH